MKLYGTTTSPFVRRVRVAAAEIGIEIERVDTATEAGMAALRELTPIRKVPIAIADGTTLFDSRVIIDWMTALRIRRARRFARAMARSEPRPCDRCRARRGDPAVLPAPRRRRDRRHAVCDAAARARRCDLHVARHATRAGSPRLQRGLGLPKITIVCALDWMDFRKAYPTERASAVESVRAAWAEHPSLAATRPHA